MAAARRVRRRTVADRPSVDPLGSTTIAGGGAAGSGAGRHRAEWRQRRAQPKASQLCPAEFP
eukprot:3549103-Alexandrium_andersonii.AAC.1